MVIYVSGPMTGYEDFNYPAFHEAKRLLEEKGYTVLSPADLPIRSDWEWSDYMDEDIASVFEAEGIATLPGWRQSKGARIEVRIAECRDIPVKPVEAWLA